MGPGQKFLIGSFFCAWILLKITKFFIFFPLDQKISSGWVKKFLGQSRVSPFFTAGQKYARVGSQPVRFPFYINKQFQNRQLMQTIVISHFSIRGRDGP